MTTNRRSELFREVNDRIYELLSSAEPDLPGEFFCECGEECGRRVELSAVAFAASRRAHRAVRSGECGRTGIFRRVRREPTPGFPAFG